MADCLQSCWCVLETQKCTQFQGGVKRRRGRLLLCSLALRDPEGATPWLCRARSPPLWTAALREPPPLSPSLHSGPEQLAGEDCPGCGRGHLG